MYTPNHLLAMTNCAPSAPEEPSSLTCPRGCTIPNCTGSCDNIQHSNVQQLRHPEEIPGQNLRVSRPTTLQTISESPFNVDQAVRNFLINNVCPNPLIYPAEFDAIIHRLNSEAQASQDIYFTEAAGRLHEFRRELQVAKNDPASRLFSECKNDSISLMDVDLTNWKSQDLVSRLSTNPQTDQGIIQCSTETTSRFFPKSRNE